jgi:hypothetical protein
MTRRRAVPVRGAVMGGPPGCAGGASGPLAGPGAEGARRWAAPSACRFRPNTPTGLRDLR